MIKAVFFDWGGVIADDPGDDFLASLLYNAGASQAQIKEIHSLYMRPFMRGQISESEYWLLLKNNYNIEPPHSTKSVFLAWQGLVVNPDMMRLVRDVQLSGRNAVVLSNVIEPTYRALKEGGAYNPFDNVVASCVIGCAKPERDIYEYALKQAGVSASESLFIDDKLSNISAASQLGFATVLAQNPHQIIADTRAQLQL
ncbi:HAD family phosphatase [Candidatus Saccharibacteria bacterium]|nr:HAD family phosphatase [Candidatus Saccharibacteria bacterium]